MTMTTVSVLESILLCIYLVMWILPLCYGEYEIFVKTAEMTTVDSVLVNIPHELKIPLHDSGDRRYKILAGKKYAVVTPQTGILSVASLMDREELCPTNPEHCYVDVEMVVLPSSARTSPTSLKIVKIQIEITDINDNPPVFENQVIEKQISEGVDLATSIRLDSAVDPDFGINSIQRYNIRSVKGAKTPSEKFFRLDVIKNIDGTKIPQLELKHELDREKQGMHELILEAIDGGKPALTGTAIVRINVSDSNDNSPIFDEAIYIVKVNEHERNNTIIKQLQAEDKDTGINGRIRYTFPSVVSTEDREIFSLNADTGAISIKNSEKLDFELNTIHHLTVEASDMGPNAASAYATVAVQVQDINDNKPNIEVSFMELDDVFIPDTSDFDAIVREDIDVGSYLAFVTITDKDGGKNGSVSCRTAENGVFDLQSIEENTSRFLMKIIRPLDRELMSFYDIDVEAWDHGEPSQKSLKKIRIKVGDINDNAPSFAGEKFLAGVSETATNGTVVITLQAEDIDESPGPNSKLTYSLVGSEGSVEVDGRLLPLSEIFEIDKDSGEIRLARSNALDAEIVTEPGFLTVSATDNGHPRLNTTTKVMINIVDENDNSPVFDPDSYVFHIDEHSNDGSYVGSVMATDADTTADGNGHVSYSLERYDKADAKKQEDEWLQMFQIDRKTGNLNFYGSKRQLDREARGGLPITITAVATDAGVPRKFARARIDIFLRDINDNAPIITYPNITRDIAMAWIQIHTSRHADETNPVLIDNSKRGGDISLSDGIRWSPMVLITKDAYKEAKETPISLTQIRAMDPDEGANAQTSFVIVEGNDNGYFEINFSGGNVTLNPNLELTKLRIGCHVLKILVRDHAVDQLSSYAYANIYLSRLDPRSLNKTKALEECRENPLYPIDDEYPAAIAGLDRLTTFIIIGFTVLIFIILAVIVVILIKCKCCSSPKTYSCREGNDTYGPSLYGDVPKKRNEKKKGRRHFNHNGQGTVDSRSSFHSEWTASQTHIALEKMDLVSALPTLHSEGSIGSRNSGHDSGTGDSMPSDAYHAIAPHSGEVGQVGYPLTQYTQHIPLSCFPGYSSNHADMMELEPPLGRLQREGLMTAKCTEECLVYGHSDTCWMPDSLPRPPSRMTSFKQQQSDENLISPNIAQQQYHLNDPNHQRNPHGDLNTPYYYDPGRKFVQSNDYQPYTTGSIDRKFSTFREDNRNEYETNNMGQLPEQHQVSQPESIPDSRTATSASARSELYQQSNMHPRNMYQKRDNPSMRGRAYVKLQGYDQNADKGSADEVHSNLSSTSSTTKPYSGGFSHNKTPYYNDTKLPQIYHGQYQAPNNPNIYYDSANANGYQQAGSDFTAPYFKSIRDQMGNVPYEEDYSASNLLLSPVDNNPDYRQPWEQVTMQPKAYLTPVIPPNPNGSHQQMMQSYGMHSNRLNLSENNREPVIDENETNEIEYRHDGDMAKDKMAANEDIDAEAVVAEIDGLLL